MTDLDFMAAIAADSGRFHGLLAEADPGTRVASCPDWDASDLLWHLVVVQWFWGSIVSERLESPGPAEAMKPERPGSHRDLVDLSATATARLMDALADVDDDTPMYTWAPDRSAGFVRRRQAHEALVHRVDAELVAGVPSHLDQALAEDGVDEALQLMLGLVPEWAEFVRGDHEALVVAHDTGRSWHVLLGRMVGTSPRSGKDHDRPALTVRHDLPTRPSTVVAATAAQLDLWLWGRVGDESLDVSARNASFDALAHVVNAGIQ